MKVTRILLISGLFFLLLVFVLGIYVVPRLQAGNPSSTRQSDAPRVPISDVYVDITYATPSFVKRVKLGRYLDQWQQRGQPFLIGINTHVGTIMQLDLKGKVLLKDSNGDEYPALGSPVVVSEHHNMYLLLFPLKDNHGEPIFAPSRKYFQLVLHGVGKTPLRTFEWKLPLVEPSPVRDFANTLAMGLGILGALMVILSPCAIELTTYYTGIIAGVVGSAIQGNSTPPSLQTVRRRTIINLAGFIAGFTTLYTISGATVSLMGEKLMQLNIEHMEGLEKLVCTVTGQTPSNSAQASNAHAHHSLFGPWGHYLNLIGASFLIYFALRSLGVIKSGGSCFLYLARLGQKLRNAMASLVARVSPSKAAIIRCPVISMQTNQITPLNCYFAGLGLSVGCLTCMGGAILYPLLIFVGTAKWYWGALILGGYSLAIAIPMAAIAVSVGDFSWKYSNHRWVMKSLQWTSATVMILVALLIAFDRTRFINTVVFTILGAVGGSPSL